MPKRRDINCWNLFLSFLLQEFVLSRIFTHDSSTLSLNRSVTCPLKRNLSPQMGVKVSLSLHETESASHFLLPAHFIWRTKQESRNVPSSAHTWSYVQVSLRRAGLHWHTRAHSNFCALGGNPNTHWSHSVCFVSVGLKCGFRTTLEAQLFLKSRRQSEL